MPIRSNFISPFLTSTFQPNVFQIPVLKYLFWLKTNEYSFILSVAFYPITFEPHQHCNVIGYNELNTTPKHYVLNVNNT